MNATCKRLLSWLVVVTMVLSMVPVFDLSNFAVTTKAAISDDAQAAISTAEGIINDAKELGEFPAPEDGETTITEYCPVCGTDQEWTALSGTDLAALTFTKEGSAIVRFHYYLSDNATFSGAAMTTGGGNNHYVCLNLNGKTLTTGAVAITTNYGNIFNIMDTVGTGVLAGKSAGASAAAINVQNPNAKVNIYGGTIKRATGSNAYSSVAYIQGLGGQINLYDGTIDGTGINNTSYATVATLTANDGRTGTFNVYGGEVKCGTTTGDGNIQVKANAVFNLHGGTVKDGVARGGGNFNVNGTGVLNVHGGTISGGQANKSTNITVSGGNIILTSGGTLNMDGGVICGGTTTAHGGNIQIRRDQVGHIDITGGKIYGGTAGNGNGHNIYAYSTTTGSTLNIGGTAEIAGDIYAGAGVTTTLSGTPKIMTSGLTDAEGNPVVAKNGGLTVASTIAASGVTGGEIQVTAALNKVLTDTFENAATVAQYFSNTDATLDVGVNDANKLVVVEYVEPEEPVDEPEVGVFAPESCGGMAYCDACIDAGMSEEDALVEWTPISGTGLAAINSVGAGNTGRNHYHYYLSDDASFSASAFTFTTNGATTCVHLNGKDLTAGNRAIVLNYGSTINIMDTTGGSITGKYTGQNGAAIYVANPSGIVNIYGGTFKKTSDSHASASVVWTQGYGGTINMYGGTIDATGVSGINAQPGVVLKADEGRKATFNMYGGNIIGAATTGDGGAVYLTARTTFNLHNGTISGGSGRAGGNIMVYTGTLNIHGGTISGGKATLSTSTAYVTGGNIAVRDGGVLTMDGGVVCNGEASVNGGNIALWTSVNTVTITGGKIYGGVAGTSGANIFSNGTAGSALTIGGTAEIAGDIKTNHTTTNTLSGSAKILTSGLTDAEGNAVTGTKGYEVAGNTNIVIDELTANAQIEVTGTTGVAFTAASTNASTVAGCFSTTTDGLTVAVNDDNQLYIAEEVDPTVPVVGVFNPEGCNGYAYCPVCEGEPVLWTDFNTIGHTAGATLAHGHYYLSAPITDTTATGNTAYIGIATAASCFNLNGQNLTVSNGRVFGTNNRIIRLNIMDTAGTAVVTGNGASTGAVFHIGGGNAGSNVNIYGGTYKTEATNSPVIYFTGNGGTVTLREGATIDASEVTSGTLPTAVYMQGGVAGSTTYAGLATFNLQGGTIKGDGSDLIYVGNGTPVSGSVGVAAASFTMTGGKITNGIVTVNNGNTLAISGGEVDTIETAQITDETYADTKTTVTLTGTPQVTNLKIGEGTVVNVDGLTEGAEIAIDGKTGVTLIETTNATAQGCIEAYREYLYVAIDGNALSLAQMQAAVVTAEGETFYPTVAEAITKVGTGYVALYADGLTVTISGDTYIDNRGYTVTVEGEGKLYAMDAANDDYVGYGGWTVNGPEFATDVINPVNGNRYIVIQNTDEEGNLTGTSSAHRVEMYLTFVSLRTAQAGLYYKAAYKCDNALADRVNGFGIVFNATVDGETVVVSQETFDPAANIYSIDGNAFTPNEEHVVNGTSTQVFNIFNTTRSNTENVAYGEAKIGATPYINVDTDGDGMSDADPYVIANLDNEVYKANAGVTYAAWSLFDVLKAINDDWASYESAWGQVQEFYDDWANYGMSDWAADLANIAG